MDKLEANDTTYAQHEVRKEMMDFMKDLGGENAPVEIVIAFRCPDGQVGFYKSPGYLPGQVGLLELVKSELIAQGKVQQVQPAKGAH